MGVNVLISRWHIAADCSRYSDDDTTPFQHRAASEAATEGRGDTEILRLPEDMDEPTFALPLPAAQDMQSSPIPRSSPQVSSPVPQSMDEDHEAHHETTEPTVTEKTARPKSVKALRLSRHGIPYPSLPAGVVKRITTTVGPAGRKGRAQISKETLGALVEASDCFFEQVSDDLGAYAEHAGRQTIDERDMITLMKR